MLDLAIHIVNTKRGDFNPDISRTNTRMPSRS